MVEVFIGLITGVLIIISVQLGIIIKRSSLPGCINRTRDLPLTGTTVNVNINGDGSLVKNHEEADSSVKQQDVTENNEVTGDQSDNGEESEDEIKDPDGEPSEEAIMRAQERERLAEELRSRNARRQSEDSSAQASSRQEYSMNVVKCPECGAENTALRQNCFNCNIAL